MESLKSFISLIVIIAYSFLSISGINNDLLCVHESGKSNFETIIDNDCVNLFSYVSNNHEHHNNHNNNLSSPENEDPCYDLLIPTQIISFSENIIPEKDLTLKNFFIIKYLSFLEQKNFNPNQFYLKEPDKPYIAKKIHINNKNTIVLTI
ncbi:MAG: hypothetical protein U0457_02415 [Candidatus Sericytochromatia bacterium]